MANPDAAIDISPAKEPLLKKDIEKRRLIYVYKTLMDTPEAAASEKWATSAMRASTILRHDQGEHSNCRARPARRRVRSARFLPPSGPDVPVMSN